MNEETASYASIYRLAVREAERNLLGQEIYKIETATHAAVGRRDTTMAYSYGTLAVCETFVEGIEREVQVVRMTGEIKERLTAGKVRAFGGR